MDISNGTGIRVSLFTQGCNIHCKGCFNSELWNYSGGKEFTKDTINHLIDLCRDRHISGLSILGGEPLSECNLDSLKELITSFKKELPDKTIWLWTGYYYHQLNDRQKQIVNMVNTLVDGPFEIEHKDPNLLFRGSSNQKITYIM